MSLLCCSSEDGEKKDHDKAKDEAPPEPSVKEKKAPKKRLGQKKELPEVFMASFFAGLEIYQTKMLVRCLPHLHRCFKTIDLTNLIRQRSFIKIILFFTELPGQKFLQPSIFGTFCCLCHQLHSSLLQSKLVFKLYCI